MKKIKLSKAVHNTGHISTCISLKMCNFDNVQHKPPIILHYKYKEYVIFNMGNHSLSNRHAVVTCEKLKGTTLLVVEVHDDTEIIASVYGKTKKSTKYSMYRGMLSLCKGNISNNRTFHLPHMFSRQYGGKLLVGANANNYIYFSPKNIACASLSLSFSLDGTGKMSKPDSS